MLETIRGRRSIRRFTPDPIPPGVLEEVIEAACWAPYGTAHDDRVLVVLEGEQCERLVRFLDERLAELIPTMAEGPARQTLTYARSLTHILAGVPVVIAVFAAVGREGPELSIASAACAVQNLMLAAHARGLGSCFLTGAIYLADEIAHRLGLDGYRLIGLIPLGYPAEEGAPRREWPTILRPGTGNSGELPARPEPELSALERARHGAGERVLVVTDDPEVDAHTVEVLRRAGYEVSTVAPDAALAAFERERPMVAIVDAILRGVSGYDVARAICAAAEGPCPVLIATAAYDDADEEQALAAGASDVLTKPVREPELLARVRALADSRALYERIEAHVRELERVNEELRGLQRMRDHLTHMIVHDMRTPLTNVLTGLQTVEALDFEPDLTRELVPGAIRAGQDLADMINNLLDISKMEAGELQPQRERLPAAAVVAEALQRVNHLAREGELELQVQLPDGLPLHADRELMRRVLTNLLSNAIKFTPAGGSVVVEGAREGDATRLCVRDTGEGIPEDQLDRLFAKFSQVDRADQRKRQGTGLGLAFVKLAAEAHGGTVTVQSRVGEGSTFCVTIPDAS
ncbi:MAG: ATP-binding protein [Armatimonadota bacterium]